jgi:hypothetical protein
MSKHTMPWIESPFFEKELADSPLTAEEKSIVKSYADNGYLIFDPEIPLELLDNTIETLKPKWAAIKKDDDLRIQDAWTYSPHVKAIASHPKIKETLKLLYQRAPFPFQTLSFMEGTQQDTHSDMIHFNTYPARYMCGVWVALEDITDFNGPLHYYPGSHKLPFYDMIDIGIKASASTAEKKAMMMYFEDYTKFIKQIIESLNLKKASLNIKKGQAIIWAANLLHGGNEIINKGSTRYSQVTHYFFENCMYYTPRLSDVAIKKLHLNDLTDISTGKKVKNTYFGEEVSPVPGLVFQQKSLRMLSRISHLFPQSIVDRVKQYVR